MDANHIDRIARALCRSGPRRALPGPLATVPLMGRLFAPLDADEADAQGRRKRRKKAHKHGRPRPHGKGKKHHCKPNSIAETCAGRCGPVRNACGKRVDCGSCDCDPTCDTCFACQREPGAPGTCGPEAAGASCGYPTTCDSGQLIIGPMCDGSGVCQPGTVVSCPPYTRCNGDACATPCRDNRDCFPGAYCNIAGECERLGPG